MIHSTWTWWIQHVLNLSNMCLVDSTCVWLIQPELDSSDMCMTCIWSIQPELDQFDMVNLCLFDLTCKWLRGFVMGQKLDWWPAGPALFWVHCNSRACHGSTMAIQVYSSHWETPLSESEQCSSWRLILRGMFSNTQSFWGSTDEAASIIDFNWCPHTPHSQLSSKSAAEKQSFGID